jgi:hypothetical protein
MFHYQDLKQLISFSAGVVKELEGHEKGSWNSLSKNSL